VPVKILFAPDHTPELELIKQMACAQQRLDRAIFAFTGSSAVETRGDGAPTELTIRRAMAPRRAVSRGRRHRGCTMP
jgi:hypothetical protein